MTGPRVLKMDPERMIIRVKRLRDEGFSFKEIGRQLGISGQFAKKTFEKSLPPVKNELQPGG